MILNPKHTHVRFMRLPTTRLCVLSLILPRTSSILLVPIPPTIIFSPSASSTIKMLPLHLSMHLLILVVQLSLFNPILRLFKMVKFSFTDQLLKAIRLLEANGYRVVKSRQHKLKKVK